MVDNVVKPLFIRGGVPIHGAVIFFALFGGLAAFGPVGFLVGPLAVSFLVAVVRMYRRGTIGGLTAAGSRRPGLKARNASSVSVSRMPGTF